MSELSVVEDALRACGLHARGGFRPRPEDGVPVLPGGEPSAALVMVGNAGPGTWRELARSPEHADGAAHALDRWSSRIVTAIADRFAAHALFPFGGPPHHPFQRWAMRADDVHQSPIGPLIHAEFGLWHAYRGALSFSRSMELPAARRSASPCDACDARPCLVTCPVGAFGPLGYDVPACVGHIGSDAGSTCLEGGCLARSACPVGTGYRYDPAQAEFHMTAFLRANEKQDG